jgi:hypothetical protein
MRRLQGQNGLIFENEKDIANTHKSFWKTKVIFKAYNTFCNYNFSE